MQETQNAFIQQMIQNPHEIGRQHRQELERLSQIYPASNFLHLLLAKSCQNESGFDEALYKAAIYSANRKTLFYLIHQPGKLLGRDSVEEVGNVEEVLAEENPGRKAEIEKTGQAVFTGENVGSEVGNVEEVLAEENPGGKLESVNLKSEIDEEIFEEIGEASFIGIKPDTIPSPANGESSQTAVKTGTINDEIFEEIGEASFIDVNKGESTPQIKDGESPQTAVETGTINDEIFEEIGETSFIDVNKGESTPQIKDGESPQTAVETGQIDYETFEEIAETPVTKAESRKPKAEGISPALLESFHIESVIPSLEELPAENTSVQTTAQSKNQPSRYHDEKMPYSFMWWLDKTRQEHAQTYQPYASPFRPDMANPIENLPAPLQKEPLEQQYIEHIFHLRSVEELEQSTTQPQTVPFLVDKKETKIIEKFIREEPQIRTPRPEKLDVENKARKSTEDKLDMVSETLAKIYTEQMLYDKAIDTYQKLGLKYPGKSGYFAARIDELEQKIR